MIRTESPLWRDATFSSRIKTSSHAAFKPDDTLASSTSRRSSKANTLPRATPLDGKAISRSESARAPTCTQKSTTATSIRESSNATIDGNNGLIGSAAKDKAEDITDEEWIEKLGQKLKKSERVKKDHVDGILDHYKGERTEKLIKHGLGNYTYKNKFFTYEGEWFNGVKHGRGKITMKDGSFYEGTFQKGEMTGRGVKVWENGTKTYVGHFKQGKMHGEGKIMSTNGDFYSGGFAENLRQGYGESKDMEGLYRGMHERGQRQGQGMFIYSDTATYVGDWLKNKPHGNGVFKNKDGFVITGQFTDGKPSVWPTKIEINETGPIKVFKGEYFNISFRYVNQDGESTQCYEGFKCKMTAFFKKPSLPKSKKNNLPDLVKIEDSLQIVKTPFFKAISYPICNYANYVQSLHYPYNLVDDESLRMKNEPLQDAFEEIISLKYFLSSLDNLDVQMLMDKGLKFPEEVEHESNKWPLPIVDEYDVDTTGSGGFSKIALPDADRPDMPYEPFVIDTYLQEYEKNKKKHGVYFGEKPKDVTYDALGRPIVDDSDKEEEDEESIYPGLTVEDLELPVEKQLIKILFNGYARKGLYCIKLEDIAPESVYTWFSLPRPEPAYIQVKVVEHTKRVKSKHRSSSRGSARQRADDAAANEY